MKLPDIQYKAVQPLAKGSVEQAVKSAQAPFEAVSSLAQSAYIAKDHYELLQDQENALENAGKTAGIAQSLNMLSDKQVNMNQLPPEVVENYRNSPLYSENDLSSVDGDVFVPTHKIADSMYQWANLQYDVNQSALRSERAYTLYDKAVGKDVKNSFETANKGVRASQIDSLRTNTEKLVEIANFNGEINKSLFLSENAYGSGIIEKKAYDSMKKTAYAAKKDLTKENLERLNDDAYNQNMLEDGKIDAVKDQHNDLTSISKEFNGQVLNKAEVSEANRQFNISAYKGDVDGKAQRLYNTQGYAQSIGFIEMQERKLSSGDYSDLPEGMTVKDAQNALGVSRSLVQARRNALNSAEEAVAKQSKSTMDLAGMIARSQRTGGVTGTKDLAIYDENYNAMVDNLTNPANGFTPEQIRQGKIEVMEQFFNTMPNVFKKQLSSITQLDDKTRQLDLIKDYAYLKAMNPNIAAQFAGDTLGYLEMGAAMLKSQYGQPDSLAMVEALNDNFSPKTEGAAKYAANIQKAKEGEAFKDEGKTVEKIVEKAFDGWTVLEPESTIGLEMTIKQMRRWNLGRGVAIDEVDDIVARQIATRWGRDVTDQRGGGSRWDGDKVVYMPVEKVAGAYAPAQFELLKKNVFKDKVASGIYLEADGLTAYQSEPSWKIMYHDPTHDEYPNNKPYQINSFNQDNVVQQSVFAGQSGARWRPNEADTAEYKLQQKQKLEDFTESKNINKIKGAFYDEGIAALEAKGLHPDMPNPQQLAIMMSVYNVMTKNIDKELKAEIAQESIPIRDGKRSLNRVKDKYEKKLRKGMATVFPQVIEDYARNNGLDIKTFNEAQIDQVINSILDTQKSGGRNANIR